MLYCRLGFQFFEEAFGVLELGDEDVDQGAGVVGGVVGVAGETAAQPPGMAGGHLAVAVGLHYAVEFRVGFLVVVVAASGGLAYSVLEHHDAAVARDSVGGGLKMKKVPELERFVGPRHLQSVLAGELDGLVEVGEVVAVENEPHAVEGVGAACLYFFAQGECAAHERACAAAFAAHFFLADFRLAVANKGVEIVGLCLLPLAHYEEAHDFIARVFTPASGGAWAAHLRLGLLERRRHGKKKV